MNAGDVGKIAGVACLLAYERTLRMYTRTLRRQQLKECGKVLARSSVPQTQHPSTKGGAPSAHPVSCLF